MSDAKKKPQPKAIAVTEAELPRYRYQMSGAKVPPGPIPGSMRPASARSQKKGKYGTIEYPRRLSAFEKFEYDMTELEVNVIYILHFSIPLARPKNNTCACHYSGSSTLDRLPERLAEHRTGNPDIGSHITAAEIGRGGQVELVAIIEITPRQAKYHRFEKQFKKRKNTARYCPLCRASKLQAYRTARAARKAARIAPEQPQTVNPVLTIPQAARPATVKHTAVALAG